MYFIIGGDGKEYGPISEADLRKWISEGRLSAQSLAKAESDAAFRPLAEFPEIADAFASAPPPLADGSGQQAALQRVKVPAVGLMISAGISLLMSIYGLFAFRNMGAQVQQMDAKLAQLNNPQLQQFMDKMMHFLSGPFGIANDIFQMIIAILILLGAIKMQKLRSYEFAFAAAILSVLPCITPCCGWVLGLIFGIWSLVVLAKPEVKSQFS